MKLKHYDHCAYRRHRAEVPGDVVLRWVNQGNGRESAQCMYCGASVDMPIKFKSVPVKRLEGGALKYAVAAVLGLTDRVQVRDNKESPLWVQGDYDFGFDPDTDPELFYKLMLQFKPWITPPVDLGDPPHGWDAEIYDEEGNEVAGRCLGAPDPMIALCKAIVHQHFGVKGRVRVPARLLEICQS